MKESELIKDKLQIEQRFKESELADMCVKIAVELGENRESRQGECYTNIDFIYKSDDVEIDCNIGQNMQGDGELKISHKEKQVLRLSNSYPHIQREDLPVIPLRYVGHTMIAYIPGEWEGIIDSLAKEL